MTRRARILALVASHTIAFDRCISIFQLGTLDRFTNRAVGNVRDAEAMLGLQHLYALLSGLENNGTDAAYREELLPSDVEFRWRPRAIK